MSDVKLGTGRATGMFYHAPAGTALPTDPTAALGAAWDLVGDVSDAGITLALNKTTQNIKNWANVVKRVVLTDHSETIQTPVMDTTEEALKTVFGADNVSKANGVVTANLSNGDLPEQEAYLWVMKDGDDMMMIGCTNGQISAIENVSFAPGAAINWTPTVTAMDDGGFQFIMKEAT